MKTPVFDIIIQSKPQKNRHMKTTILIDLCRQLRVKILKVVLNMQRENINHLSTTGRCHRNTKHLH